MFYVITRKMLQLILLFFVFYFQASMHSKKWSLLQELTRDIHTHSNKAQVLAELANCIATGELNFFTCQKYLLYFV
jgi:hypothetical protein